MSLGKSLSTGSANNVKLMRMNSIPGTEDLRFLLTTAKDAKKCAELPFQSPSTGATFTIKVIPPAGQAGPKWTFERGESPSATFIWMRESAEVMMIQNKIKIDIVSQSAVHTAQQEETGGASRQAVSSNVSATFNNIPTQNPVPQMGFDSLQQSESGVKQYSGWMPEQFKQTLPQAYDLKPKVANNIMEALTDAKTGLTKFFAFVFFMLREVSHHEKNGTQLTLLCFDFVDAEGVQLPLTAENMLWLTAKVAALCTPLDVMTRLETGEFALLLSGTGAADGAISADVLYQQITEDEDFASMGADARGLAVGCASLPDVTKDPAILLSAAIKAKELARKANKKTFQFPRF